jgi:hypothetical protein
VSDTATRPPSGAGAGVSDTGSRAPKSATRSEVRRTSTSRSIKRPPQ